MASYREFKEALGPVFGALCEGGIYASTHKPQCCRRCGHDTLSASHASYVFFTRLDESVEWLHLRHAFESDQKKRCALSILQRFCDVEWDGDRRKTIRVRLRTRCWMHLRRFVRARAIALYWFGLTAHLYAPGGVGCKRDRDEFEAEMGCKLVLE